MPAGDKRLDSYGDFISYDEFIASVLAPADNLSGFGNRLAQFRGFTMRKTPSQSLLRLSAALLGIIALSALAVGSAWADDADPPGVAARLSYAEGAVSIQPAGLEQWAAANVNRPFTTGDRLWTDQGSRAELELGPLAIRLAQTTGFTFVELSDSTVQMQVTAGTLAVHVPQLLAGQSIEIDTPTLAVAVAQPGDYRIEVNESGDATTVKVIAGNHLDGRGISALVHLDAVVAGLLDGHR